MSGVGTGIDTGSTAWRILRGVEKGGAFQPLRFLEVEADGSGEPPSLPPLKARDAMAGLGGRDAVLRMTRVPPCPEWRLRALMDFEIEDLSRQAGGGLVADYNLLAVPPGPTGEDTVLLALAREELIERRLERLRAAGISVRGFCPSPLALHHAYLQFGDVREGETVLLVNLGQARIDVAITHQGELVYARHLSGGGRSFTEAIARALDVGDSRARQFKERMADAAASSWANPTEEKIGRAVRAESGELLSMLESTLALFRAEWTEGEAPRPGRLVLCGGGARLRGLDGVLGQGLGIPAGRLDVAPALDVTRMPPEEAELLAERGLESVLAVGLALVSASTERLSVQVLPRAARRRRRLLRETLPLAAAGTCVVAALALHGFASAGELDRASASARRLRGQLSARGREESAYEAARVRQEAAVESAAALVRLAEPSAALLVGLRAVQDSLPPELWVTSFRTQVRRSEKFRTRGRSRPRGRKEESTWIVVEGRGQTGASAAPDVFEAFLERLQTRPGIRDVESAPSTDRGTGTFHFTVQFRLAAGRDPEGKGRDPEGRDEKMEGEG